MNRLEEYLNKLNKKDLIYLFLSIPVFFFMIYYQFIYSYLEKEHNKLIAKKRVETKKLRKISTEIRVVKNVKHDIKPYKIKLSSLKEDYKFIKYSFSNLELIKLSEKKLYNVLTDILNFSKKSNLTISIFIDKSTPPKPFNNALEVTIKGKGNYLNIVKFIDYIESRKILVRVKELNIIKSDEKEKFVIKFESVGIK